MENKVLSGNLGAISKYNPELAHNISNLKDYSQSFELIKTELDEYNLLVNEVEIHSQKGAVEEAKKIIEGISNINEPNSLCIIFGLGLGYLFDEVVQCAKGRVILFEPNVEILKCTLEIVEMKGILSKPGVRVCTNIEDLKRYIGEMSDKLTKISVSFLTSYYKFYEKQIIDVANIVEYTHGEAAAIHNTICSSGYLTTINTLKNLKNLCTTPFIGDLTGKFQNKPALIVSAGPSLAKNIDIIQKNQDKFVIFCVGPALKTLLNNGITPDFAVIIEANNTEGQVSGLNLEDSNLIIEPYTNPYIWDVKTKNKFMFLSTNNFLNDWLADVLKIDNKKLYSMGTVSYCALEGANLMGCNPIVLIGQDLAYTDGKCYSAGSAYEDLECKLNPQTQKFEISPKDYDAYKKALVGDGDDYFCQKHLKFLNENLYTVDGQNGEKLPTQTGYAIFIKHFEKFAQNNFALFGKKNRLINSSVGGAQINGFENLPLGEILGESFDKNIEFKMSERVDIKKAVSDLLENVIEAKAHIGETIELIKKIDKEYKRRNAVSPNVEKLIEKLYERDRFFVKNYFEKNKVIYFSIYQISSDFTIFLVASRKLRNQAATMCTAHIVNLENAIERLDEIITSIN